jgi:uncharacterized protein YjdB
LKLFDIWLSFPTKYIGEVFDIEPLYRPNTNSDGTFSYTSSNESVATISGSTVTIVGLGQTTITATLAASSLFL